MSTYYSIHMHVVYATKGRQRILAEEWRPQLFAYSGGILRNLEVAIEAIGGVEDHVHLLLGFKTKHAPADVVRELKKGTTGWIREEIGFRDFNWQEGYACLSVSPADRAAVKAYIANQRDHHQRESPLDELSRMLKESGVEYDDRFFQ